MTGHTETENLVIKTSYFSEEFIEMYKNSTQINKDYIIALFYGFVDVLEDYLPLLRDNFEARILFLKSL